jgi:GT2 family glycosyltransferase
MKKLDLEIIIVNFNSQFWLKKTLESLKEYYLDQTRLKVLATVVDNASSDDSVSMVTTEFPWVQLIQLSENEGFAVANNAALKHSTARYCMLLNSDVEFLPASNLDLLIKYADKHPQVGVISPKLEFNSGELDPAAHRGEPTLWASIAYFSGLEELFPRSPIFGQYHQGYKDMSVTHEVDACSGAAMIVRRSVIEEVGVLDERFFMYAEDLDWCKRIREAGYKVIFFPEITLIHHKYKSGIRNTSQAIARKTHKHFYDTMLQYYDKHYAQDYPAFVRTLLKYFVVLKKGAL